MNGMRNPDPSGQRKKKALIWLVGGLGSGLAVGFTVGLTVWAPLEGIALGIALGSGMGGVPASLLYFGDLG